MYIRFKSNLVRLAAAVVALGAMSAWGEALTLTLKSELTGSIDWTAQSSYESASRAPTAGDTVVIPANMTATLASTGDGIFLYPATDRVLPSIRLAQLRDGVEDYEWLKLAEAKAGREAADGCVRALCPALTTFTRDPQALRRARTKLAELITSP